MILGTEKNGFVREHFDAHADHLFAGVLDRLKTAIAQLQPELVFTLGTKTPIAFAASSKFRALVLFLDVYFGMDFKRLHGMPHPYNGQGSCRTLVNVN